jgi:FkbM family methyltransferase
MSSVLSFIYKQGLALENTGVLTKLRAKGFHVLRRIILRMADPPCEMNIWGHPMRIPFSHELPGSLARDRHYDQILQRISGFIRATQGAVCGIDVGANIGDTIAASIKDGKDRFLGIEPNPVFFQYLTRNLAGFPNVQLLKAVCSTADGSATYRITTARGTASFEKSGSEGQSVQIIRLDSIVTQFPEFSRCNFLKIDTDGHDFEVLRGARRLIVRAKPAILFECEMRNNPDYIGEVLEALGFFAANGYQHALIYDSRGELFGILELNDTAAFLRMLFYQVTGGRCNYDVLVMPNAEIFLQKELEFFVNAADGKASQMAAQNAARLMATQLKAG